MFIFPNLHSIAQKSNPASILLHFAQVSYSILPHLIPLLFPLMDPLAFFNVITIIIFIIIIILIVIIIIILIIIVATVVVVVSPANRAFQEGHGAKRHGVDWTTGKVPALPRVRRRRSHDQTLVCFSSCTMVENREKHRQNSHRIIHCPTSEGVSEVSERANE